MRRRTEKPVRIYVEKDGMGMEVTLPREVVDAYGGAEEVEKYFHAALHQVSADLNFPELKEEFGYLHHKENVIKMALMADYMRRNDKLSDVEIEVLRLQKKRFNRDQDTPSAN